VRHSSSSRRPIPWSLPLYHPDRDQSEVSTHRMAKLSIAYAQVRTVDRRQLFDRERERRQAPEHTIVTPYRAAGAPRSAPASGSDILDFGRYHGCTIRRLARADPDY
jgi:hypothetical protein